MATRWTLPFVTIGAKTPGGKMGTDVGLWFQIRHAGGGRRGEDAERGARRHRALLQPCPQHPVCAVDALA